MLIACSISSTSPPRTSPTMIRSGRMRRLLRSRSRIDTTPVPSNPPGRLSRRTTCGWFSASSAVSSIVITRSLSGTKIASAFSSEVLPELVPPLTRILQRALTAASSRSAISWFMVPSPSSASGVSGSLRNLRIDTTGPCSANGGITTLMRPPSGSRASTIGFDSSSRRPIGARIRRTMRSRWPASAKRTGMRSSMPWRDTYTSRWPLTRMSSTAGSFSKSSMGPKPASSLVSASAI